MFNKADELRSFWRWSATTAGIFLLYSVIRIFTGTTPEVNSLVLPLEFPVWLAWLPAMINAGAFVAIFMLLLGNKKSQSFLRSIDHRDDYIVAAIAGLVMSLVFSNVYSMDGIILGSLLLGFACALYLGWTFEPYAVLAYMAVLGWSHNLLVQPSDHSWPYSLFVSPIEAIGGSIIYMVLLLVAAAVGAYLCLASVWAFKFCFPDEEEQKQPVPDKLEPTVTIVPNKPIEDNITPADEPDPDAEYAEAGAAEMAANLDDEAEGLMDAVDVTPMDDSPDEDTAPEVVDKVVATNPPAEAEEVTSTEDTKPEEDPEKK